METTLIFHHGLELPEFAAFVLLDEESGVQALRDYFEPYIQLAREHRVGLVLDTPTWRASPGWGERLGYSAAAIADVNTRAVALLEGIRRDAGDEPAIVICGCIGPRGDAYRADDLMNEAEAERYHSTQIGTFAERGVDMASALTLTNANEAVGIVRAATRAGLPVAVSFTVETDGRLPSGQKLRDAMEEVDVKTDGAAAYFMINCAHPTHFLDVLDDDGPWIERIRGIRANASKKSHAELDEAEELDEGDPADLARRYLELAARLPNLTILGGCCGTDDRHIGAICSAWQAREPMPA
jgi:S-methylmethionine-dependent homocysteine/selenocysteine methylase